MDRGWICEETIDERGPDFEHQPHPPEISVVIPTFCRANRLRRLVAALEQQTLARDRFEVVVVDNASTDDTPRALRELVARSPLTLRTLVETTPGPAATRNAGWKAARGEVIAFVDDDCVPDPDWLSSGLDAMRADARLGVVQGQTRKPEGEPLGDWSVWRQITAPTPYFEACNIFYRRAALAETPGFDEGIGNYGEDCAAGWAVIAAGWRRGFAEAALAYHDVEERGVRYHLRTGLLERHVARLARRHPEFREEAFWRPWAFRRENAAFTLAVAGLALSLRHRPALLLVVPYVRLRMPPPQHPRRLRFLAERIAVDSAQFAGMRVGSLRYRLAVL
ncbi:MAG TPA: glycosyltransferase [Acidimicrobiia bacterium]|nr:glycosyltransferase [Acidimicrobiia bacterium]